MLYVGKISRAVAFSMKVHEVDQKQKRKGKNSAYITHPLTVGIILSRAGASKDTIVAGILHDTIEDSIPEMKVSGEMLAKLFGENVANLVESVSEPNKALPWDERKQEALTCIDSYSHDSLLLKSADIVGNATELIEDYKQDGSATFNRFNASKEDILKHYLHSIAAILERWPGNPLKDDLVSLSGELPMVSIAEIGG